MDLINMRLSEMSQEQLFEGIELIKRNNEEIADRKRQERAKTEIKTEDAEVVDNATEESNRIKDAWYNLSAFMANSSQFDEELEELEKELEELRKEYGIKSSVECFDEDDFDDLTSIADASRPLTDSELGRYKISLLCWLIQSKTRKN
jgi:hypothetical protein